MTTTRTVQFCARCGALDIEHEIHRDGTRGKRLGTARRADGSEALGVACAGYQPGRVEERPPEEELRRRLAAVLELHHETTRFPSHYAVATCVDDCSCGWRGQPREPGTPAERCPIGRAARGET